MEGIKEYGDGNRNKKQERKGGSGQKGRLGPERAARARKGGSALKEAGEAGGHSKKTQGRPGGLREASEANLFKFLSA